MVIVWVGNTAVPACVQGAWASPEEEELKKGLVRRPNLTWFSWELTNPGKGWRKLWTVLQVGFKVLHLLESLCSQALPCQINQCGRCTVTKPRICTKTKKNLDHCHLECTLSWAVIILLEKSNYDHKDFSLPVHWGKLKWYWLNYVQAVG